MRTAAADLALLQRGKRASTGNSDTPAPAAQSLALLEMLWGMLAWCRVDSGELLARPCGQGPAACVLPCVGQGSVRR